MNHHYSDIRDKLGEPLWWDEAAGTLSVRASAVRHALATHEHRDTIAMAA